MKESIMPQERIYPNSIIPEEYKQELQELFNEAIPRIVNRIRDEKVTHIILTEKTARLFKVGFQRVLKQEGLDVKVGSFAFDYLSIQYPPSWEDKKTKIGKQQYKKLDFIKEDVLQNKVIMIIDEYKRRGATLSKAKDNLEFLFYNDKIITDCIQQRNNTENIFSTYHIVVKAIYEKKRQIFQEDDKKLDIYHTILKNKKAVKIYRDTSEQISDMMLQALGYDIKFKKRYQFKK